MLFTCSQREADQKGNILVVCLLVAILIAGTISFALAAFENSSQREQVDNSLEQDQVGVTQDIDPRLLKVYTAVSKTNTKEKQDGKAAAPVWDPDSEEARSEVGGTYSRYGSVASKHFDGKKTSRSGRSSAAKRSRGSRSKSARKGSVSRFKKR